MLFSNPSNVDTTFFYGGDDLNNIFNFGQTLLGCKSIKFEFISLRVIELKSQTLKFENVGKLIKSKYACVRNLELKLTNDYKDLYGRTLNYSFDFEILDENSKERVFLKLHFKELKGKS